MSATDSKQNEKGWKKHSERSNPFLLKLICWIALNIGRNIARFILYFITAYFFLTSPRVIRASRNYFRRVQGNTPSLVTVIRHIHHFSSTILDRVFFLTDQHERFEIKVHGVDVLDNYIDSGKGGILLGAHHGSFEVLRSLVVRNKHLPLKVLMYREHNQMITRIFDQLNPEVADTVINLADQDALLQMQEAIEQGYFVGMLGDRVTEGERKVECKLLGDNAEFPSGPVLLASIMKVPVVLFYGLYEGGNKYNIYFELLSDKIAINRKTREQDAQKYMQSYVDRLEYYIKKSPYNWFNFYDFWHDEKK